MAFLDLRMKNRGVFFDMRETLSARNASTGQMAEFLTSCKGIWSYAATSLSVFEVVTFSSNPSEMAEASPTRKYFSICTCGSRFFLMNKS